MQLLTPDIERYSALQLFGLPYIHMMNDEADYKNVGFFAIEFQSEDEFTRDRSINPTLRDEYLQLFPQTILPLCNAHQYQPPLIPQ